MFTRIKLRSAMFRVSNRIFLQCYYFFGKLSFSFYIQTDCQRNCINLNPDIHFHWSLVRHLLPVALQAAAWPGYDLDCGDMDRSAFVWLARIFRLTFDFEAPQVWHSTFYAMCRFVGCKRGDELQHNQSYLFVHVSEFSVHPDMFGIAISTR